MTPLVFVHGFMGGSSQWEEQLRSFGNTQDVIAYDLPGYGQNAHHNALNSISGYAAWIIDETRASGLEKVNLVGHSMGGMIVQELVAQAPDLVDKLVLYGTGATGILPGRFESIATSKKRAQEDGAQSTARRIAATWFLEQENSSRYEHCAQIAERSSLQSILAGLDAMQAWSGVTHLPEIRNKTLVIWGDRDRTYPWSQIEQLWKMIDGASLAVIPDCAHAAHMEKPGLFNAMLEDFLEK